MNYRLIYFDNSISCVLRERAFVDDFAKYMNKEKPVIAVVKIRRKFKQVELPFSYEEREMPNQVL